MALLQQSSSCTHTPYRSLLTVFSAADRLIGKQISLLTYSLMEIRFQNPIMEWNFAAVVSAVYQLMTLYRLQYNVRSIHTEDYDFLSLTAAKKMQFLYITKIVRISRVPRSFHSDRCGGYSGNASFNIRAGHMTSYCISAVSVWTQRTRDKSFNDAAAPCTDMALTRCLKLMKAIRACSGSRETRRAWVMTSTRKLWHGRYVMVSPPIPLNIISFIQQNKINGSTKRQSPKTTLSKLIYK